MDIVMKRIIITLALMCVTAFAFAQKPTLLRQRMEIAEVEAEAAEAFETRLEVFYMDDETPRMYYLSLGNLGVGVDIIQVNFDPIYELFIPLGGTLDEAVVKMEKIKAFYDQPKLATTELSGCFAPAYPNDKLQTVTVTRRQFIFSKVLEFSIPTDTEDFVRATHISKGDFSSLLSAVKIYRKIHPNEP